MVKQYPLPQDQGIAAGISVRAILWTGLAVLGTIVLVVVGAFLLHRFLPVTPSRAPSSLRIPAALEAPRLQTSAHEDLMQFQRDKQALLDSYGWVERKAGLVRIPIEQAMELFAKQASEDQP